MAHVQDIAASLDCFQRSSGSTPQRDRRNRASVSPSAVWEAHDVKTESQIQQLAQQMRDRVRAQEHAQMELRRRLNLAHDERGGHRANAEQLVVKLQAAAAEQASLRAQLGRQGEETRSLEARLIAMESRLNKLAVKHSALQEKNAKCETDAADREARAERQEQELASREQELHLRQKAVADREAMLIGIDAVALELEQKQASFESWRKGVRQSYGRQLGQFLTLQGERELQKENQKLKEVVQEQRDSLFNLESQLRHELVASSFPSPGEFLRMTKKYECECFAHANADMKLHKFGLERSLTETERLNEILLKSLPDKLLETVMQDVRETPVGIGMSVVNTTQSSAAVVGPPRASVYRKGGG